MGGQASFSGSGGNPPVPFPTRGNPGQINGEANNSMEANCIDSWSWFVDKVTLSVPKFFYKVVKMVDYMIKCYFGWNPCR